MTDPGYWEMLKAETKWMCVVIGGLLLVAGWNLLETAYLAFQGFAGGRWEYEAMLINVLWFSLITAWVELRYWRRRAVAAEQPLQGFRDVELSKMEWLDRNDHQRPTWMSPYREGFGG